MHIHMNVRWYVGQTMIFLDMYWVLQNVKVFNEVEHCVANVRKRGNSRKYLRRAKFGCMYVCMYVPTYVKSVVCQIQIIVLKKQLCKAKLEVFSHRKTEKSSSPLFHFNSFPTNYSCQTQPASVFVSGAVFAFYLFFDKLNSVTTLAICWFQSLDRSMDVCSTWAKITNHFSRLANGWNGFSRKRSSLKVNVTFLAIGMYVPMHPETHS
jgi:hypothetical protein